MTIPIEKLMGHGDVEKLVRDTSRLVEKVAAMKAGLQRSTTWLDDLERRINYLETHPVPGRPAVRVPTAEQNVTAAIDVLKRAARTEADREFVEKLAR
jgi:hypothetical protein